LKRLEENAAVFDLHGWTYVDLNSDETLEFAIDGVVVDDLRHDVTVEDMNQEIAADDEVVLVPVIRVNEGFEFVGGAQIGDDRGT